MVVEDTGDLGDVADGKADEHGALGLKPNSEPVFIRLCGAGGNSFRRQGRALLPLAGEGGPAEPGRMREVGEGGIIAEAAVEPLICRPLELDDKI